MAEQIKRKCRTQETIEYEDIMGLPQTIKASEVLELLDPEIERMTQLVSDTIKELNGDKTGQCRVRGRRRWKWWPGLHGEAGRKAGHREGTCGNPGTGSHADHYI